MLKQHFGNDIKITAVYMENAIGWKVIKPEDSQAHTCNPFKDRWRLFACDLMKTRNRITTLFL